VTLPEGPFGEFTGYYASQKRPAPVMQVTAMHPRDDAIPLGSPPMEPPRFHFGLPLRAAAIWSDLERCGVVDVVGAWQHVAQLMTVVALRQRYGGPASVRADRGGAELHGEARRHSRRRRRPVGPGRRHVGGRDPLRTVRNRRYHPQRLELGARPSHRRRQP